MKTINLTLIVLFVFNMNSFSQTWEPEWTATHTQKVASTWSYLLNVDFQNNIYTGTQYGDSLFVGDTVLIGDSYNDWKNWAVLKYDDQGQLQTAFDLLTPPNKKVFETVLATDNDLNMYIACEFQDTVYFLDTVACHGSLSDEWSPEILIAKVTPQLQVEWTRVISSPTQDNCPFIFVSDDGYLYTTVKHYNNGYSTDSADYFGQDMAVYSYSMCSVLKMDMDGNLVWRKEILGSGPALTVNNLIFKNENEIFIEGFTNGEVYFSDNILFHPLPGQNKRRPFVIEINTNGDFITGTIPNWGVTFTESFIDKQENFYFTGYVWDTVYFGNDTIIQHEDTTMYLIAKTDANLQPVWYETVTSKSTINLRSHISLVDDTLYFAVSSNWTTELFDTIFETGFYHHTMVGQVTPEGVLNKHTTLESNWGLMPNSFGADNCNNLLVSGSYRGEAIIGNDTLIPQADYDWDGLTVKLDRNLQPQYNLGNDTTVCDNIVLSAPEGYQYYQWNDSLTQSNSYTVTETGEYKLAFANDDGCWTRDAINIEIDPTFSINIGQDTAISPNDTLFLSVPDIYDSYLWWNGSTENTTYITGEETGSGTWIVWVDVVRGACIVSDSIEVMVNSINQLKDIGVSVYPNPVNDVLNIISDERYDKIELLDLNGRVLISQNYGNNRTIFNLSEYQAGVYIIRVTMKGNTGYGKIIKQ